MNLSQRPDSFEVADYTGVLRRRWWVLVAITLICVIGAVGYVAVASKVYTSQAEVYVAPTGADNSNQVANSRTGSGSVNLDTEAQIVTSGTVTEMAIKAMHSSLTPYDLSQDLLVTVPANSQDLDIACNAPTASAAATCANSVAAAYLANRSASSNVAIQQQLTPLQSQVSGLQKKVASLNSTIASLPSNSPQRATAQANLNSDNSQLSSLNSHIASLDSELAQSNGGSIITKALAPSKPTSPKKLIILPSGLIIGLILGLIAAFVWDRRDKRIHTPRDAERFFDLPIMIDISRKSLGRQVALASPRSKTGKQFTDMAHNIASSLGEGSHVVLVVGATPGPAVSVVAANLAATLARTHSEAVLVCAAFRDSVSPEMFGIPAGRGLAEVVAGRATVGEVARGPASAPGLWVIPPGADTSLAEYNLQHDTAKALTSQLRRDARYVVVEAQATEDGADTFSLAEFADAAVLVVETQRTTRPEGDACIKRLVQMRTQLLGAAVLPPVKDGISVRAPQPVQRAAGVNGDRQTEAGRDGSSLGRGQMSALSGSSSGSQDRNLVRPARSAEGYGDPADHIPGS
jgi:capsular polysaccharide biosynthesis protein/Mrp family chromosome partitioning ATPase